MRIDWLPGRNTKRRIPVLAAFLVLLNALILRAIDPMPLVRLRDLAFDEYQRIKPRVPASDMPVRIVDIDEASLAEYGQWPWPRTLLASLVEKLSAKGAAVIAFDVIFAEPDRSSVGQLVRNLPSGEEATELRRLAQKFPDNDEVFSQAIRNATVVTGFAFDAKGGAKPPRRVAGVVQNSGEKDSRAVARMIAQFIPQQVGAVKTIDVLERAASGNGSVTPDIRAGVVRRVPLFSRLAGQRDEDLFPSLALEALRTVQGASTYLVRWSGAQGFASFGAETGVGEVRVGNIPVGTDSRGRIILYDSGHLPSRYVSARDVLKGTAPSEKLDAHIVLVGTSSVGLQDVRTSPIEEAIPGVEIQAQIVEQMLSQTMLRRPDYADGAEFLYLAAIGLLFVVLLPRLPAVPMALVAATGIAVAILLPWFAFDRGQLLIDPIYPPVTLAAIYIGGSVLSFMQTERDRRQIRGAFNLYLAPDQVEAVTRDPSLLKLGGEMREITVMFTDVRGFTRISEQFDPAGLTRFMNSFLTPMTELIQSHKGTIDKYMGDAIMAFWNAPLDVEQHAAHACKTALDMRARLIDLNEQWTAEAEAEGRHFMPINIGIGLNTGQATVGNFGSSQRLTYSCLGDEVNLASRLESQCKSYGVGIIIGENTSREVPGFATLELDLIVLKGKTEHERIFVLLGDEATANRPEYRTLVDLQAAFLDFYRAGQFAEARAALAKCMAAADTLGWGQRYYQTMTQRIDGLIEHPPADWKGVYVATEK